MNKNTNNPLWKSNEYKLRLLALIVWDVIMIHLASVITLVIRFELEFNRVDPVFWDVLGKYFVIHTITTVFVFNLFQLYTSLWNYAGMRELGNIVLASVSATIIQFIGTAAMGLYLPRSYFLIYPTTLIALTVLGRFGYRLLRIWRIMSKRRALKDKAVRTMLVGAGAAGHMLVREMKTSKYLNYELCCIIDDDINKKALIWMVFLS